MCVTKPSKFKVILEKLSVDLLMAIAFVEALIWASRCMLNLRKIERTRDGTE